VACIEDGTRTLDCAVIECFCEFFYREANSFHPLQSLESAFAANKQQFVWLCKSSFTQRKKDDAGFTSSLQSSSA
jgi:hypothetical protein